MAVVVGVQVEVVVEAVVAVVVVAAVVVVVVVVVDVAAAVAAAGPGSRVRSGLETMMRMVRPATPLWTHLFGLPCSWR